MRIRLKFIGKNEKLTLPIHHNEILQGIIYNNLDENIALKIHNKGKKDPESLRALKLFVFSRLIPGRKPKIENDGKHISFYFPLTWIISSPIYEFIVSFYNNLNNRRTIHIHSSNLEEEQVINLLDIYLEPIPLYRRSILIETLSPITIYRTDNKEGKSFTHYFAPSAPEFNELILLNLLRKYRTLYGANFLLNEEAYIKPVKVSSHENIIYYKSNIIKGWSGIFELSLPKELFSLAFSCGLGAKNSQGFGCIGIWKGCS